MKSILEAVTSTKRSQAASTRIEAQVKYERAKMFFGSTSPEAQAARRIWQALRLDCSGGQTALAAG